jgi:TPR repeat protein
MYEHGMGCEKDLDKAIEWYGKSAEDEFEYSQKRLLELVKIK